MTQKPLSNSKGHQAGLLTAAFTHRQLQRSVSVGTYWAWETAATLPSAGAAVGSVAWGAKAPTGEERGGGISCRHAHSLLVLWRSESLVYDEVKEVWWYLQRLRHNAIMRQTDRHTDRNSIDIRVSVMLMRVKIQVITSLLIFAIWVLPAWCKKWYCTGRINNNYNYP